MSTLLAELRHLISRAAWSLIVPTLATLELTNQMRELKPTLLAKGSRCRIELVIDCVVECAMNRGTKAGDDPHFLVKYRLNCPHLQLGISTTPRKSCTQQASSPLYLTATGRILPRFCTSGRTGMPWLYVGRATRRLSARC